MSKILGLHTSHHGCMTYVVNNEIIFHTQLDRYNKIKTSSYVSREATKIIEQIEFDTVIFTGLSHSSSIHDWNYYFHYGNKIIRDKIKKAKIITSFNRHHIYHAYCALTWNKNYSNIIVIDGMGSVKNGVDEMESFYKFEKKLRHISTSNNGFGKKYEQETEKIFNLWRQEGKMMAYALHNDQAYLVQKQFEKQTLKFLNSLSLQGKFILTGGCAQNVKNNYELLKVYDVFADPFNGDFGISLGAINYLLENKLKIKSIYLGISQDLDLDIFKDFKVKDTTHDEVAKILIKDPVAIFQSRSEQGQRGLGNRSLLANANCEKSVNKITDIKKREYYRPFACSILQEEAKHWFKMNIEESPYMMYLFDIKQDKKPYFKMGLAKDDTCRIQTVKDKDNLHYYNLINSFYQQTKLPFVVNTSLNLPGEVLVETMYDLRLFLKNSSLNYAYLPEINKLITK